MDAINYINEWLKDEYALSARDRDVLGKIKMYAEDIERIITETEEIQDSNESAYTKEKAKINAYEQIKELIGGD